ncbi:MAG: recombination regulator RecX [Burkholderiaceae bacterium]
MPPPRPSAPSLSLKGRALRLLSQREHSRAELARKLQPHLQDGDDLDAVLRELQDKGFLSDERAVASLVYRRAPGRGAARIRQELQAKGVDAALVDEAVSALQATEAERAQAAWQRRFGGPPRDAAERARQLRFLIARGFASAVAYRTVPRCTAKADAPDDAELDDMHGDDGAGGW